MAPANVAQNHTCKKSHRSYRSTGKPKRRPASTSHSCLTRGSTGSTGSPIDTPSGPAGTVLFVEFTLAGTQYVALNAPKFSFTEAVSFMIACADQAETDRLWAALTANGGSELGCGWLKDRWGVTWQVTPTRLMELVTGPDQDRAARALAAIGNMRKINIAEVERAADGR